MMALTCLLNFQGLAKLRELKQPFPHIVIEQVLSAPFVRALAKAILGEPKKRWNTDLYQFWQTNDLAQSNHTKIKGFVRQFTSIETKNCIKKILGCQVLGPVDCSGFVFEDTDYLLPHDDQMPGRKVAYILYLSTSKKKNGGALDLFGSTPSGKPTKVKKSITPRAGTLVLFPVSRRSIHQVAEHVGNNPRITVGGWFNE